ncbi:hypothetical protein V5O48_010966 [Marasmius crinis-equi]|uniref:ferric-chelate reductase (NADPH) n=1 Tax=Marasmius crinis-equi TaxID=585013 RepID=A0ABR3F6X1_9AGAR
MNGTASVEKKTATATGPLPQLNSQALIYRIDIFLLALIALLVLFRLPRFLARLWRISEWSTGYRLHSKTLAEHPTRRVTFHEESSPGNSQPELSTNDNHTLTMEQFPGAERVSEKGTPVEVVYPPHVASTTRLLRPLLKVLHTRIAPGLSVSHACIMAIYLSVLVFPAFFKTNAFTDPVRFGWITVGQLPFVFLFATKNNLLGLLMGVGYEKLNFLHRFVGRVVILSVNVHSVHYFYVWFIAGHFRQSILKPHNLWGAIGLICFNCLYLFSTSFIRTRFYTFFITNHILSFSLLFPAIVLHKPSCTPWVLATLVIYTLDLFLRAMKTRLAMARIRALPHLGLTRVEIPDINAGWRAGQHVRLRVVSGGMGLLGWSEIHPFTIASCAETPEGMVLMCKKAGDWTEKLYDLATGVSSSMEEGRGQGTVRVMVEGPYGGSGHRMFASFSAAVFVVGGSGITFALSSIQELINADSAGNSRVKVIELVWVVQDPSALLPLLPTLTSLVRSSTFAPLRISIFYTRASIGKFPFPEEFFRSTRLSLSPGRPKLDSILESSVGRLAGPDMTATEKDRDGLCGVVVGVCGPLQLADGVFEAVGKVDSGRRDKIGGIEVHEE